MLVASSTGDNSFLAFDDRLLGNQVNGPVLVHDAGSVLEAHIAVVILVVYLKKT